MNEVKKIPESSKSQTELIIDKFIQNLKAYKEFNDKTLSNLKTLVSSGNLTQYKKIEIAIKAQTGDTNEDN